MKEVSITFWEVTPEEALKLPKGTQLIEYDPATKRLSIKRSDFCLYDYTCVYLWQPIRTSLPRVHQNGRR